MDKERDIINKFKIFQDDILKILRSTEKERNKCKGQVDGLIISVDVLQERYNEEQKDNIKLRGTIQDLQEKNENLEKQVNQLELECQKLKEQLNASKGKNSDSVGEKAPKASEPKEAEVNDEIKSIQKDYSFMTQFTQVKKEKQEYDELLNQDSTFDLLADTFGPNDQEKNTTFKIGENGSKKDFKAIPESSNLHKNNKPLIIPETIETTYGNEIIYSDTEKTPEKRLASSKEKSPVPSEEKSPVLRDLSGKKRKSNSLSSEANENENAETNITSSPRVVDYKTLLKPKNMTWLGMSPAKRPAMEESDIFNTPGKFKSPKRSKASPRKTPKKPSQRTPKKSPVRSQLKSSYLIDVEKTGSGMRKMTQLKLNFSGTRRTEKENVSNGSEREGAPRPTYDFISQSKKDDEDDDLIDGSPHVKSKSLNDLKSKPGSSKASSQSSETQFNEDPEATYVSSLFIKEWKQNKMFDDIPEEKPPTPCVNLSPTERIPDLNSDTDSPGFAYKRDAVRKKADRKKLPGQVCYKCEDYYRNVYGDDINKKEYQKLLDKCSRHRDKYPQPETPPGVWKPYLTMTCDLEDN